jgi:hypothetical protein
MPMPMAVRVQASWIYIGNANGVYRVPVDLGSPPEQIVTVVGGPVGGVVGVALDATHVYWVRAGTPPSVGMANLDGSNAGHSRFRPTSPSARSRSTT